MLHEEILKIMQGKMENLTPTEVYDFCTLRRWVNEKYDIVRLRAIKQARTQLKGEEFTAEEFVKATGLNLNVGIGLGVVMPGSVVNVEKRFAELDEDNNIIRTFTQEKEVKYYYFK